ncbi:Ubiquitin-like modifier-activating enzyme atg7 [Lecanosticta acicola]|uniref:Ubiquitin-like modifier-activating enzyme atg7 n=1 Tax=Lecanosticta acicola TaxID=111012 RepID=A0AAI8YZR0_9PEZI|nr:Ubiquitin-like modifier-activating enzyme atg7 [Lecanosticta acicola]
MLQPLMYAPWMTEAELGFFAALASLKINHDKLDSSARKVLGLYEYNHKDIPAQSTRMQLHGTALTSDEPPKQYYRAEGLIRNFNTVEEYRSVNKTEHLERAARMVWDAICDGTIYSCPSLLCSFSIISFADLKKYKFTYHAAYPAIQSDPVWRLVAPYNDPDAAVRKLEEQETTNLVNEISSWQYQQDSRQRGFFLAKRLRRHVLEEEWRQHRGEIEEETVEDGNLCTKKKKTARSSSLTELGFLWFIGPLESFEKGFFDNAAPEDRFVCFADPSTYESNPGWMLRNLLVLVRQRWKLDKVQVLCYRDTHTRRDKPTSLVMTLQSSEPVWDFSQQDAIQQMTQMSSSSALAPGQVDRFGELIIEKPKEADGRELPYRPPPEKALKMGKITGWERDTERRTQQRTVDLAAYLDPSRLAEQAVDLNLKLIKWRISPSIDLETIKQTKCLLLGAGTLGSYIARNLMGWGVRKITFVDNGRVSYSNPVRQPLYLFQDCTNGGAWKADRAAAALSEIFPGVDAEGVVLNVPMAGHPIVGDETRVQKQFEQLQRLIKAHDAIFLLMDTREARWLPTVMAKSAGKIVINTALGFDTYMVMRHGVRPPLAPLPKTLRRSEGLVMTHPKDEEDPLLAAAWDPIENEDGKRGQPEELGCYFCQDVVAPADSLKSATLDQQCTVTRPGAAPIASALAVELLASITQHKLKGRAPAADAPTATAIASAPPTDPAEPGSHPLGTIPHQLRGFMSTWQTIQVKGKAYDCCAACSPKILGAYEKDGWEFVKRALNEKGFVEEVSGLAEVQRKAEEAAQAMEGDEEEDWPDDEGEGELI